MKKSIERARRLFLKDVRLAVMKERIRPLTPTALAAVNGADDPHGVFDSDTCLP
jgi:hypothetical protein